MRVAVLGAGLQGACVALELADRGAEVDLFDRNARAMTQASAQNEGKIHLGYIYAQDCTRETARTMVRGALTFAPLLRRWLGNDLDSVPVAASSVYVVHRDSLISVEEFEAHLAAAHAIACGASGRSAIDYFGHDYRRPPSRLAGAACAAKFDTRTVVAAFDTEEIAIDPERLAELIRARLSADPRIQCRFGAKVLRVTDTRGQLTVEFEAAGQVEHARYDHVVNALWDGRLAIDATVGLPPDRPWLHRVKDAVRVHAAEHTASVPSTTTVLGAFGDTVAYSNGVFYLSWYPAGMCAMFADLAPPWPLEIDDAAADRIRSGTMAGLETILPGVAALTPTAIASGTVTGGVIFAWGRTDISDPASELHTRYAIGPYTRGRYHTIDTGKFTTAPLFAQVTADRISGTA